jgi:hypothetical protein
MHKNAVVLLMHTPDEYAPNFAQQHLDIASLSLWHLGTFLACEPFDSNPWRHLRWKALPIDANLGGRHSHARPCSKDSVRATTKSFYDL